MSRWRKIAPTPSTAVRHRREIDGQTELIMRKSIKRRGSAGFIRPSCELHRQRRGEEEQSGPVCAPVPAAWPLRSRRRRVHVRTLEAQSVSLIPLLISFYCFFSLFLRRQVICVGSELGSGGAGANWTHDQIICPTRTVRVHLFHLLTLSAPAVISCSTWMVQGSDRCWPGLLLG